MFLAKWFGVDELPGHASGVQRSTAENAWQGLTVLRWLMLLTIIISIGSLILHATQRSHGSTNDTGGLVAALGTVTALLLIYRVLINLPSPNRGGRPEVGGDPRHPRRDRNRARRSRLDARTTGQITSRTQVESAAIGGGAGCTGALGLRACSTGGWQEGNSMTSNMCIDTNIWRRAQ